MDLLGDRGTPEESSQGQKEKWVPGWGICCRGGPENLTEATSLQKEASEHRLAPKTWAHGRVPSTEGFAPRHREGALKGPTKPSGGKGESGRSPQFPSPRRAGEPEHHLRVMSGVLYSRQYYNHGAEAAIWATGTC